MFESGDFILLLEDGQTITGSGTAPGTSGDHTGGGVIGSGGSTGEGGYVVWDPSLMARGLEEMKDSVGTAFNVGIWVFLGITGLYAMISIIRSLFG